MSSGTITESRRVLREPPMDVVGEILKLLPIEHVLRCKLLSKACYDLIKNSNFGNEHFLLHLRNTNVAVGVGITTIGGIFTYDTRIFARPPFTGTSYAYNPPGYCVPGSTEVVGSCNGLLCIRFTRAWEKQALALWNPTTGESFEIPKPTNHYHDFYSASDVMGFGYKDSGGGGGDYKVVKIGYCRRSYSNPAESYSAWVWSMSTNMWEEDIGFVLGRILSTKAAGLFIKGSLYWLPHSYCRKVNNPGLVSYNMNDDTFRLVPIPDNVLVRWEEYSSMVVNDFMGSLALFIPFSSTTDRFFKGYDVWVMTTDPKTTSDCWNKKFSIGFTVGLGMPTRVSIDGNFLMETSGLCLVRFHFYDPHRKEKLEMEHALSDYHSRDTPWCFTESLVPIKQHAREATAFKK